MKAPELVTAVLLEMKKHCVPGVSTFTIDSIAEKKLKELGGFSYNKGYRPEWARVPYPAVTCISVNNVIAHGIPNQTLILKEGDLVNLDIGVIDEDGNCGDSSFTVGVGKVSDKDELLLRYAKKILYAGIAKVKEGVMIGEIASAMAAVARERNMLINHQICGHYIGKHMHESAFYHVPNPHYQNQKDFDDYEKLMEVKLEAGKIVCLEPCVTNGKDKWGQIDEDGWEFRTKDGAKSAMFEHMIKILPDGYEILTNHFTYKKGDSGLVL